MFVLLLLALLIAPSFAETINFESVLVNKNVVKNNERGLEIQSRFTVEGLKGKSVDLSAYFYNADGSKLKDFDGSCATPDGQVAVSINFPVEGDNLVFDTREAPGFILFVPYKELHLGQGDVFLKLQLELFLHGTSPSLAKSNMATVNIGANERRP